MLEAHPHSNPNQTTEPGPVYYGQSPAIQTYNNNDNDNNSQSPYADPVWTETPPSRVRPPDEMRNVPMPPPLPPTRPPDDGQSGGHPTGPKRSGRNIMILAFVLLAVFVGGLLAGHYVMGSAPTALPQNSNVNPTQQGTVAQPLPTSQAVQNLEDQRIAAIEHVTPAIVQIDVRLANGSGIGSGIIIDKDGYIATNNHVVEGAQSVEVTLMDGSSHAAKVVGTDPADDLAVVKIDPPANMVVATLGDSSKVEVGQSVLAIGNPLGITQTVTSGIVSALNRTMSEEATQTQAGATIPNMIQTDAPINPGNSGGALIDLQGQVIGMPTLGATNSESNTQADGIGFAIPSNQIKLIAQQIIEDGKVTHTGRAAMGVSVTSLSPQVAIQQNLNVDHGVYVLKVTAGSAAEHAGMKAGDVIVGIDNQTVMDTDALGSILATKKPGDQVKVTVFRNGQQSTLDMTLGELPAGA